MIYTLAYQQYKYEHGLTAAEQRAADIRAGELAAEMRNLRRRLGGVFRLRHRAEPARRGSGTVTASQASAPTRVLTGIR